MVQNRVNGQHGVEKKNVVEDDNRKPKGQSFEWVMCVDIDVTQNDGSN